jgi:ADP-heptose:LPS heptosyltransferase
MNNPFTSGLLSRLAEPPRKIALLRASRIGDFLCATPAYRALRMALPEAEITMITLPMLQDLVLRSPHLDRFVAFPGYPGIAEQFFDARRTIHFFQEMQEEHFDLAIQMQGTGVNSNTFMLLLGSQATAGFIRPEDSAGRLDAALRYPQQVHEIEAVLALTTFLGVPAQGKDTEFPLWSSDHKVAAALLEQVESPLIGLHPTARDATRRWALDRFGEVGNELHRRYGGTVVILGEEEDVVIGNALSKRVGEPCLNLMGKTSLAILGAVIEQLSLLVTNDTGPAHIAYALGTPTMTIFGASTPQRYGPLQEGPFHVLAHPVHCRPCGLARCPIGYTCLEGVTVTQVIEAAEQTIRLTDLSTAHHSKS